MEKPLPITAYILAKMKEKRFQNSDLVKLLGYRNTPKGIRNLNDFMTSFKKN
ncbi:MAG: hypothetical protein HQK79_20820, partial [Desulfobacterales bacterium]|nr:hypothetical protein [Desulfobacterales bacterium]